MKDLSEYQVLNRAHLYREFKATYGYPKMHATSYRRVLYGQSTYLEKKSKSPYIADLFKFFAKKLHKPFIDVAFDLLNLEYFGKKNTLLDVFMAETDMSEEEVTDTLKETSIALSNIRLCDLNKKNRRIYTDALSMVKE